MFVGNVLSCFGVIQQGEGVPELKKGRYAHHAADVARLLRVSTYSLSKLYWHRMACVYHSQG